MISAPLADGVVVLVCLVWVANFVAPFIRGDYPSDPQLNAVFLSIVGGALALRRDNDAFRY